MSRLATSGRHVAAGSPTLPGWCTAPSSPSSAWWLSDGEPHPWREVHVGGVLGVLGSLACAVEGGALHGAPTIGVGVLVLVRALRFDLPAIVRAGERGSALLRTIVGTLALAMATGLIIVASLVSFGLIARGDSTVRSPAP